MPSVAGFLLRLLIIALGWSAVALPLRAQNDPESRRAAIEMLYPIMIAALEVKNYNQARHICDQAILWEPQNPVHHYNLACIEAQTGGHRLPQALGALELSLALGFDEPEHLANDPDLIPLRTNPKFKELVRKAEHNANARDALASFDIPPPRAPVTPDASAVDQPNNSDQPAPPAFRGGVPVGLYLMSRYQAETRAVEHAVWYFAPDGAVYRGLTGGFSKNDLAAPQVKKGHATSQGDALTVTWSDGAKAAAELETDGKGFNWNMGIFRAVTAFADRSELPGVYRASGDHTVAATQRLEFRADGTYVWEKTTLGHASLPPETNTPAAPAATTAQGRWELRDFSLILTETKGIAERQLAFPVDDEATVVKPDQLLLGGTLFKRQP